MTTTNLWNVTCDWITRRGSGDRRADVTVVAADTMPEASEAAMRALSEEPGVPKIDVRIIGCVLHGTVVVA